MADPSNSQPNSIPVMSSPVAVGTIVSAVSQLIAIGAALGLKLDITDDQITAVVAAIFQLVAIGSTLYAFIKRYTSKVQPLAMTQASADDKSATLTTLANTAPQGAKP